jgi:hypothetical protein
MLRTGWPDWEKAIDKLAKINDSVRLIVLMIAHSV